ncbi:hypothetical protein O9929_26885 [Vibrio lentus]|nr:hypothetical protein [Vibrio lentus]
MKRLVVFCGTGCSVLVGTQNGKVVATQGGQKHL